MKRVMILGLIFAAMAAGQEFQPDPSEPGAQDFAARQYLMSRFGLTTPPVGWVCRMDETDPDSWWTVECYPDPAVLAEQEAERKRFYEELRSRAARFGRRR